MDNIPSITFVHPLSISGEDSLHLNAKKIVISNDELGIDISLDNDIINNVNKIVINGAVFTKEER